MGFFDSSSSSSTSNFTQEQQKNLALSEGATGISAENSEVTINTIDAGAVQSAFDAISANNATGAENYENLLTATSDIYDSGASMFSDMTSANKSNLDSLVSATADLSSQGGTNYKNLLSSTEDLFGQVFDLSGSNYDKLLKASGEQQSSAADLFSQIFDQSLSSASTTMAGLMDSIGATQNWIQGSIDTVQSKGTFDNRTIMVIGVAFAAVLGVYFMRRGRA